MFRKRPKHKIPIFLAICEKPLDFSVTNLLTLPETFSEIRPTARTLGEKGHTDATQDSVVSLDRRRRCCRLRRVSGSSQRNDAGGNGQPGQDRGGAQGPPHDWVQSGRARGGGR